MTISEKIDNVLRHNTLGINSIFALEKFCGLGVGAVSKSLHKNKSLSVGIVKKIQDAMGVNPAWWETGKGEIFTGVQDSQEKKGNQPTEENMDAVYKELYQKFVGTNSEYLVIHKDILKQHRIVAVEQFEKDKKQMEKDAKELDERLKQIETLTDIIKEITARPINIHLTGAEKAQENRAV